MPLAATRAVPHYAVDAIRQLIETEGYAPGAALPAQRELAERLGVSRASLREALSTLSALGLVSVQPGRGVYVQEATHADGPWPFTGEVTPAHVFQLRFALEGFAAGLAAMTLSPADLDRLEVNLGALHRALRANELEEAAALDFDFHRQLLLAADNPAMLAVITTSPERFHESQKLPFVRPERALETWQEHRRILRALTRRSPAAAQKAMREHIRNAALRSGTPFPVPAV
ncbi:GntR family transcriptional regulator [Pseudomonas oryzihabitans]|uniref:GntR family transcriptional regulator n=1 Tax=Pseudomonas oryzihabitans TaxID=47885 RepID=A0A0U4P6C1_9PSED|nr:FadR/GntR family transcriptional regulator [Pseudomonas oryzihabitans]ALZ86497.1 GntR family transcriptional regulator [Pseudomonas oryzihabitans]